MQNEEICRCLNKSFLAVGYVVDKVGGVFVWRDTGVHTCLGLWNGSHCSFFILFFFFFSPLKASDSAFKYNE